jgi:hypothetical protein
VAETWDGFRRAVFGDPYLVWHDGADFTALLELARTDPGRVAEMVALGIDQCDYVAAQSVAALAEVYLTPADARSLLADVLSRAAGRFRAEVAVALLVVTGEQAWGSEILPVLRAESEWDRLDAARLLARFRPTSEIVAALGMAVLDEEYLVRYHATSTLLYYAGRAPDPPAYRELFTKITTTASPKAWRDAARELMAGVSHLL